jgi:hypothetical protein
MIPEIGKWMEFTQKDLNPYIYPSKDKIQSIGIKSFYFAYFHRWSMFEKL